jgi:hypothetical protein
MTVGKTDPFGNNIYDCNVMSHVDSIAKLQAYNKYKQSQNPEKTGVIPQFYNRNNTDQDSEFSDMSSNHSNSDCVDMCNNSTFIDKAEQFKNVPIHDQNTTQKWDDQFDPMTHSNYNKPISSNSMGSGRNLDLERQLSLQENFSSVTNDLTYNVVDPENFTHNNMIPNFKSRGWSGDRDAELKRNEQNQRKIDLFTGNVNNVDYQHKMEKKPLFNPLVGLSNIYGMPNYTDYYESRYVPSRERRNELPTQQVRVTPGLNLGYNQKAQHGLQDLVRVLPKTIDDLRTPLRKQKTYGGVVVQGMKGYKRTAKPTGVIKHRPDRFKEYDQKDMVKSLGYVRAPTVRKNFDIQPTNRTQTSVHWVGGGAAANDAPLPTDRRPKNRISGKENFEVGDPRNITGVEQQQATGNQTNYYAPNNLKEITLDTKYIPMASGVVQKGHGNNPNDIPMTTLRELFINQNYVPTANRNAVQKGQTHQNNPLESTMRDVHIDNKWIGVANGSNFVNKGHVNNPNDIPDTTMRNNYEENKYIGVAGGFVQKGYGDGNNEIDMTMREIYNKNNFVGGAYGSTIKGHAHNLNNTPDLNLRNIHGEITGMTGVGGTIQKGHANNGETPELTLRDLNVINKYVHGLGGSINKGHANNFNPLDTTTKDLLIDNTYVGHVSRSVNKGHAHNPNDLLDLTMRDVHQENTTIGPTSGNFIHKGHAHNPNDLLDLTMRDIHQDNKWIGGTSGGINKGHSNNPNNVPEYTMREIYHDNNYIGPIDRSGSKGYVHDPKDVPDVTLNDVYIDNKYIRPVGGVVYKGHTHDPNDVPDITMKDLYIDNKWVGGTDHNAIQKGHAHNFKDVMDLTMRDVHIDNKWLGGIGNKAVQKGHANNPEYIPDLTLKDLHIVNNHIQPVLITKAGGYHAEHKGTTAPVTLKQMVENNTYVTPLGYYEKQTNRHDANNLLQNLVKEQIIKRRSPTKSGENKGPTFDYTSIELCEPIQINRDMYPTRYNQYTTEFMPSLHTRIGNHELPQNNERINSFVTDSLKNNPFINNTQHKSVEF